MGRRFLRREAIRAGIAGLISPVAIGMARPPAREVRAFLLAEKAGLRRFGFPVHAVIPDAEGRRHYRLVLDGRPIPAQFREVRGPGGRAEVALDFVASPGPLESGRFEVQLGWEVEPGPEPRGGLTLQERDGRYLISQGVSMSFEIEKNSPRFLRSVGSPRLGYLREAGGGLKVRKRGEAEASDAPVGGQLGLAVTRHGPMAVGLRSESPGAVPAPFGLELTVPGSKSWIEVVATMDDPSGTVAGLEFELDLLIEGTPTLVDLGAGSVVYGQIKGEERMELEAGGGEPAKGPGWTIRKGAGAGPPVIASSTAESPRPAEGWAHVMDSRRCSAIAVADFGRAGVRDRIIVGAEGRVRIIRDFPDREGEPPRGPKSLVFWLHFVPMPVQVGALTSPQAILAPLRLEWDRPSRP